MIIMSVHNIEIVRLINKSLIKSVFYFADNENDLSAVFQSPNLSKVTGSL